MPPPPLLEDKVEHTRQFTDNTLVNPSLTKSDRAAFDLQQHRDNLMPTTIEDEKKSHHPKDEFDTSEGGMPVRKPNNKDILATNGGADPTANKEESSSSSESEFNWEKGGSSDSDFEASDSASEVSRPNTPHQHHHRHLHPTHALRAKRLRAVYLGCMRLSRPVRTTLMAIFGGGAMVAPFLVFRFAPGVEDTVGKVGSDQVKLWSLWATVTWLSACVTSIVVDIFPRIVTKLVMFAIGVAPESLKTNLEIISSIAFWSKLVFDLAWSWAIFAILLRFATPDARHEVHPDYFKYVLEASGALFGSALVLWAEKFLLKIVTVNFHQTALKDRLEENARGLWALDKLAAAKERNRGWGTGGQTHHTAQRKSGLWSGLHSERHSRRNSEDPFGARGASTSPTVRKGSPFSGHPDSAHPDGKGLQKPENTIVNIPLTPGAGASFEQQQQQQNTDLHQRKKSLGGGDEKPTVKLQDGDGVAIPGARDTPEAKDTPPKTPAGKFHRHHHHRHNGKHAKRQAAKTIADQLSEALAAVTLKDSRKPNNASKYSARKLARKLFEGLSTHEGRHELIVEDFFPYFRTEADARAAFVLFDKDGNGDISRKEMKGAVQRIYRERKALSDSLRDMSSAATKLDGTMLGVALLIILFIWLLIFNRKSTVANLVPLATIILGFSFIFGNSAKTIFESLVFVWSTHPYDVGDLIMIDDQALIVREFGMISTVFCRTDGQLIIAPNAVLSSQKYIHNIRRSGSMWETTNLMVGYDTPLEVIHEIRTRLRAYMAENSREWKGGCDLNIDNISQQNCITLVIAIEHRSSFQAWGDRWARRTALMRHLKGILDDLEVTYSLPVQPISFHPRSGAPPFATRQPPPPTRSLDGGNSRLRAGSVASGRSTQQRPWGDILGNAGRANAGRDASGVTGDKPSLRLDTKQSFR